eukprot:TRINITY_DN26731_c0_g1_i1.p1 TRINITY_DN26731_c0_g1~~TRINITY_DN26731_c0_g1_i1.p1  ORF type:complete len:574 (+),score=83.09 TRINITY_DN26731_c0_g1_i1:74-1795(+)
MSKAMAKDGQEPPRGLIVNSMRAKQAKDPLPQVAPERSIFTSVQRVIERASESKYQELWRELTGSFCFDAAIGSVIVMNAVMIGVEVSSQVEGRDTSALKVLEHLFLCIYILELSARIYAFRIEAFLDRWVRFDMFLVGLGILMNWILEPSLGESATETFGPLMTLRMARLLRLTKTARVFKRFKEFWVLMRGFINSFSMIVWTCLILVMCIYVCSCISMELITKSKLNAEDEQFREHVQKYFHSLPMTMLSLMRFVTLDNVSELYMPLVEKDPVLALFFVGMSLVISLVFFHLIGAVLCSTTLEQNLEEDESSKQDDLQSWYSLVNDLKEVFVKLDTDNSGRISLSEFLRIHPNDMKVLSKALGSNKTPAQVFYALDIDQSGEISIKEFWDGIWDLISLQSGLDVKRMEKQVEIMHWRLKDVQQKTEEELANMSRQLEVIRKVVEQACPAQAACSAPAAEPKQRFSSKGKSFGREGHRTMPAKVVDNQLSSKESLAKRLAVDGLDHEVLDRIQDVWTQSLRTALSELMVPRAASPSSEYEFMVPRIASPSSEHASTELSTSTPHGSMANMLV